ncbi:hypothetical protein [Clostridium sp. BL-8]|uniref:hypothetical protein n=1 Tax=Clostridium sp. BL-8 TaxID=349938 RepID=UPI00098C3256|nr:hypothetical protein [Clostridium sp. BL-8]OOM80327.1 hypothetical protein CLOBL_09830 [Clostridium sp. BL-8]
MKKILIFVTLLLIVFGCGYHFYKKEKLKSLDLNLNSNHKFELAFNIMQKDNFQAITYNDDVFYAGFDMGRGQGIIREYDSNGNFIKETQKIGIGHSAGLAYRKSNGHIYACNGGGTNPTFIYEIDMTATTPSIVNTLNYNSLGNSALIAIDNDNDQLILHTASSDTADPTFSICKFDGTIIKQFTVHNQGVPQGLDYYQNQLYLFTNNKITVMDLNGNITKVVNVNESGESEGMTIGIKNNIPFIAVGYNTPNRVYILSRTKVSLEDFYHDSKFLVKKILQKNNKD